MFPLVRPRIIYCVLHVWVVSFVTKIKINNSGRVAELNQIGARLVDVAGAQRGSLRSPHLQRICVLVHLY